MFGRKKIAMLVAEFLGTGVLTLVFLSVQRSTIGIPYFVALAAGLTIAVLSVLFAGMSGAHFNPAVTIGLWTTGKVKTLAALAYIVVQLLGAWAAYGIYTYFVNQSLQTIGGHFTARILVAEAVGGFIFAFAWAAVAAQRAATSWVGVAFVLAIVVAAAASVGVVNPAVALGIRAWDVWGSMGWGTYAAGPVLGSVVGFWVYQFFFTDRYDGMVARARVATASSSSSSSSKAKPASKKRK